MEKLRVGKLKLRDGERSAGESVVSDEPRAMNSRGGRPSGLPVRYTILQQEKERMLVCVEAPTLSVRVEQDFTISAAAARKSPSGSIFLDGAAQGEPFIDNEKQIFNLDHHEGCVRPFTLATCEQAMVVVRMGLDLRKRDWTIYANEPDLDTVLAIWVLLNHVRLNDENPEVRRTIMPLIRLQGTIDAHGLEMQELAGFPPRLYLDTLSQLEGLRVREVELKREGRWRDTDFLAYTLEVLQDVDSLVYSSFHFEKTIAVHELVRATLAHHWLVIACRSDSGIYEVERQLRRLHGERLGVIVLQKDKVTYTLRRVNHFLPVSLDAIYERLNAVDPLAGGPRSGNRWGGSEEIGGSPRISGTALTAKRIVEICAASSAKPASVRRLETTLQALSASLIVPFAAWIVIGWRAVFLPPSPSLRECLYTRSGGFTAVFLLSCIFLLSLGWRHRDEYGMRLPSGRDWFPLLIGAVVASLAAGQWFPGGLSPGQSPFAFHHAGAFINALTLATCSECLFRGTVHGILARAYSTQKPGSQWVLSWPVVVSSIAYTFWLLFPFAPAGFWSGGATAVAALLFGFCCGMARERSGSLLPPILIHCASLLIPVVF